MGMPPLSLGTPPMYNGGYPVSSNQYTFNQNEQTDSILDYNKHMTDIEHETDNSMNMKNWESSLMTGGMMAAAGGTIGALTGKSGKNAVAGAVAGTVLGFALPTVAKTLKGLFGG